jgi:glucose/arabinose dehydrogenase
MRLILLFLAVACAAPSSKTSDEATVTTDKETAASTDLPIDLINLPPGFKIEVYADNIANARSMTRSPKGTLYVGTRSEGNVYALRDTDGDHRIDETHTLISKQNMPNGVAFRNNDLYFAEVDKVWVWRGIESKLSNPGPPELVYDEYPDKDHHGWKYIAFGPDGWLYIPVGAPCNVCVPKEDIFATITRFNVDTKEREIIARGVRNTVGFTWHPVTQKLWFTDNGGDWLGDDMPACELNYAPTPGMHFGYPYCHQGDFPDPKLAKGRSCSEFTPPAQNLGPHVAPLGMEFYSGSMFPAEYKNQAFIAEHGSWNRSTPIGYRITLVRLDEDGKALSYEVFADGWLQGEKAWGRPVDLEHMPDGSLLVSDDYANAIYRISYKGN